MQHGFSGTWHNQHGSEIRIWVDPTGMISGKFNSGVGADTNDEFRLTGFARGNLIAFCVEFGKYDCITSWTGQLDQSEHKNHIEMMWYMTANSRAQENANWRSTFAGSDTFTAGTAPKHVKRTAVKESSHPQFCGII